jgi:hypothetical protein
VSNIIYLIYEKVLLGIQGLLAITLFFYNFINYSLYTDWVNAKLNWVNAIFKFRWKNKFILKYNITQKNILIQQFDLYIDFSLFSTNTNSKSKIKT